MIFSSDMRAWVSLLLAVAAQRRVYEMRTVEVRAGHTVIAKLLNDLWSAALIGLAVTLKLSGPQLCLRLQGYGPGVTIF